MAPCKSTAEEVSFEWSHHRISSTDSKVRTTLHVSIIHSRCDSVTSKFIKSVFLPLYEQIQDLNPRSKTVGLLKTELLKYSAENKVER